MDGRYLPPSFWQWCGINLATRGEIDDTGVDRVAVRKVVGRVAAKTVLAAKAVAERAMKRNFMVGVVWWVLYGMM